MWIEELANGKYRAVERYTDHLTGRQKKVSVVIEKNTAQARKSAQIALQKKIEQSQEVQPLKKLTLYDLIEEYRSYQINAVKDSTYHRNYFACERAKEFLGADTLVERINAGYIRKKLLATGKEPGTLNEYLKRIKALLRWGYNNDLIENVAYLDKLEPFKDRPKKEKIQDKYLESDELKSLLDNMTIEQWKLVTQVMVLSGLRIGELIALERSDVDFKEGVIHVTKTYNPITQTVTTPKTSCSIRDVYMQDELRNACKALRNYTVEQNFMKGIQSSLFTCDAKGDYMSFYSFNKYLKETSERVVGRTLTTHALRHTHASLLLENGVSIDAISRRLGHENSKVTKEIYLHVTERLRAKDNEQIKNIKII